MDCKLLKPYQWFWGVRPRSIHRAWSQRRPHDRPSQNWVWFVCGCQLCIRTHRGKLEHERLDSTRRRQRWDARGRPVSEVQIPSALWSISVLKQVVVMNDNVFLLECWMIIIIGCQCSGRLSNNSFSSICISGITIFFTTIKSHWHQTETSPASLLK